jgi:hypothetical protein
MKTFFKPTKIKFVILVLLILTAAYWVSDSTRLDRHRFVTMVITPGVTIFQDSQKAAFDTCKKTYCTDPQWPCECGFGGVKTNYPLVLSLAFAVTIIDWYILTCVIAWLLSHIRKNQVFTAKNNQ